jgi:hypothetical protein
MTCGSRKVTPWELHAPNGTHYPMTHGSRKESKGYALGIACAGWDSDADPLLLILRTICVQSGTDQETFLRPDGCRFTL